MKAVVQDRYGSADVLELTDIDKPVVGSGDVLLRVHAASAHIGDWHVMTGLPYLLRILGFGFRRPKARVRGMDAAGRVEEIGADVTRFQPGDEVFGIAAGSFAEYATARDDKIALKPANLSFDQAATVPTSCFAAVQALRDKGEVQPGQKVLIIGAGGAVGSFAVQIAKAFGAHVTGVCSTSKVDLVRSIGADDVIDYTRDDFARSGQRYDLILDTAGGRTLSQLRRALTPKGTLVMRSLSTSRSSPFSFEASMHSFWPTNGDSMGARRLRSKPPSHRPPPSSPTIEAGKITPVIDATYPLSEVPEAIRHLEEGHARGKIVITV